MTLTCFGVVRSPFKNDGEHSEKISSLFLHGEPTHRRVCSCSAAAECRRASPRSSEQLAVLTSFAAHPPVQVAYVGRCGRQIIETMSMHSGMVQQRALIQNIDARMLGNALHSGCTGCDSLFDVQ